MNNQPKHIKFNKVNIDNSDKPPVSNINEVQSTEVASWNRQRSSIELANFVMRRLAALESVSID
ncbi:MAG: hypothetical protein Q4C83_00665 [Candidatus Saccharibacteria bacterium]|nr:hypothetical protein [Candidatus Saccharibacteria bacterium]